MSGLFRPATRWTPSGSSAAAIAGRIRVVDRRFQNDRGWWPWRSISDFGAVHYIQTGREDVLTARFDAYARANRTMVRIMGNLGGSLPHVDYRTPGYWEALERVRALLEARGLYCNLCCYAAAENIADDAEYARLTRQYGEWAKAHPSVVIRLVNEAYKNGFTDADDPRLLALAEIMAEALGHRDFAVSDPWDENPDTLVRVSHVARIAMLHPARDEDPTGRYRRWVDHLKESADLLPKLAEGVALVFDEPMGAGRRILGKRDDDPDAHLAAQVVAELTGAGYTYHWLPEEAAFAVEDLPGLQAFGDLAAVLPRSPDWRFSNSEPVASIVWAGLPGKTRSTVRGGEAFSVAYGEADWDSRRWTAGWQARDIYTGPHVRVAALTR